MPVETMERAAPSPERVAPRVEERPKARTLRLTQCELKVITLIAQGHSSKEAADIIICSKRTVDFHLANIYDKCEAFNGPSKGSRNRVWACRILMRFGILPFEPGFSIGSHN